MKIDVFVSYHTETARDVADAVVDQLEQQGLRCWYAPRDVSGDFADSIVDAIEHSSIFVVLLNESACKSKHVGREVSYACEIDELEVIPFRITDVQLSGKLKYYLKPLYWVDGVGTKRTSGMEELTKRVLRALGRTANTKIETIKYDDGGVYTGEVVNGKRHGKGKMTWYNGSVYEGDWKDDKRTGRGKIVWGESTQWAGHVYVGDWRDDDRTGIGTYHWPNGDCYEGDFINGVRTGKGKYIWGKNSKWAGDIYEGDFLNDLSHGKGTYIYANGDIYVGDWLNNERTGYGTYTYANGKVESGRFENGKYLGE